jgi:methylenetetrahydrofolate reductase (NADPH)
MKVAEILKKTKKTLISFEILPPLKGDSIEGIYRTIEPLLEFKPPYLNVTYHREEVVYKKHESGLLERRIVRKRPGTVAISAALHYKYGIEVVPHIICGGFSREETENALLELHFLGIRNVLIVRGDPDKSTKTFVPEAGGNNYAIDLVRQVMGLNSGKYLDDDLLNSTKTCFSVGVAGYPEKHPEAPNMRSDLAYLKEKIDAGAEYVVTQLFYDNQKFFNFVDDCRKAGITVPIVPGLKPISLLSHLNILPKTFYIEIPESLEIEAKKCKTNEEIRQVGIEWAIMQSKELVAAGVPVVHYYTMGKSDNTRKIVEAVF